MRMGQYTSLAALLLLVRPILAQEPEPASPPVVLPALEVSAPAQRLPEDLEQLPSSSSTIDRQTLQDGQYALQLSETLVRVPGLVVNDRHNHAQDLQIVLRGFGARSTFGLRGIRLYTDGIPATMPDGQGQVSHFDLLSAEQVRVLRGPFSALYGSASGGVIELITRDPGTPHFELLGAGAAHGMRRYGALAGDGSVALPWLTAASYFESEGYREHSAARRAGLQSRVDVPLPDDQQLLLLANALDVKAQDPRGLTREELETDRRQVHSNSILYDTRKAVRQGQVGAAWQRATGADHQLRVLNWVGRREVRQFLAIPDFVQGTLTTNPTHPGGVIDLDRVYYGADLRWTHGLEDAPAQWTVGANVEFMDERRQGFQNFTGDPGPDSVKGVQGPRRRDEDNRVYSLDPYAQLDWQVSERWSGLAGLRYAQTSFRSRDRFVVEGNENDSGSTRFDALLPVLGLRYAATPTLALHAAWSRGSETPTFNELAYRSDGSAGLNGDLRPARSGNMEVGAAFHPKPGVQADLVVFRTDTNNEIIVASSDGGRTTFRNAAATTREGLELSLAWRINGVLQASGAYAWIDARYDRSFCAVPDCSEVVQAGNHLPAVPRNSAFLELRGSKEGYGAALEARYRSKLFVDDLNSDAAEHAVVTNLRLSREFAPHGLMVFLRVDNLLNEDYVGAVIVNERSGRYFEPAPERVIGLGLRWNGAF